MRYGYTSFEIHKTDSGAARFETLAQTPVDPNKRHIRHLIAGLRPWATERLAAAWHDLGLYQASFSSVREDGDLGPAVAEHYPVRDGREEVAHRVIDEGDRVIIRPIPDDPLASVIGKYADTAPPSAEIRRAARTEDAQREAQA